MQDLFGSVRKSLVFRIPTSVADDTGGVGGGLVEKIGSCIRKSRVGFFPRSPPRPTSVKRALSLGGGGGGGGHHQIRWRKGELIGCGAFGRVYMGMNLDSGELLAIKQVLIPANNASKEKAQVHIKELEEEVKLLKNLSHPNIVRYLGTAREEETLNILLEFVPGGSISSLLGKFGSFPESVIKMYTKQLLHGLEYLHRNGIIHRDIKGANILVDNKGRIKLADFGASKQVVELATVTGAKSMKGTPYWMAPEVILQTGHNLEPNSRPAASDLLQHPFITGEGHGSHSMFHSSPMEDSTSMLPTSGSCINPLNLMTEASSTSSGLKDLPNTGEGSCSMTYFDNLAKSGQTWRMSSNDDMCQYADKDEFQSFNPMSEPLDGWPCKFDSSPDQRGMGVECGAVSSSWTHGDGENDFTFPSKRVCEDDDEVTESKIKAFLDEKALDLKKLQTPLYEEFYNTLNTSTPSVVENACEEKMTTSAKLPPKSKLSPSRAASGVSVTVLDNVNTGSPGNCSRRISNVNGESTQILREIPSPRFNELRGLIPCPEQEKTSPSASFTERRRKWKEELDQELEREREMMRQACVGGNISSPKDRGLNRKRDRLLFASPGK
ncbi:Mitogen-activated protein kinase kinase kinase NPK1 [Acorus calamus]|uniref:mitogen-activated protein kinase kinase kinase n=1 Tax=Acorus calamus TaxID=4465 RepID=A0AAV9ED58_ACOCL|nr:Mitogen-activated protein kinase kinase kinase NPK1 [Acorus calamus]